jgi:two-component system chemotaxis response regulator CheY
MGEVTRQATDGFEDSGDNEEVDKQIIESGDGCNASEPRPPGLAQCGYADGGKNRMKTLIVDDSRFIRDFLKQQLQRVGHVCAEAEDGFAALSMLRSGECFDLMLLDVNMPVMNGLECVRQLREENIDAQMKVMMVTTEADHRFIELALKYGADEFLMKPFTAQSLREKLLLLGIAVAA